MAMRLCRERDCDQPATHHGVDAGVLCDEHGDVAAYEAWRDGAWR